MNAEMLLAHFDRISEAPKSVPRLRKFILDLAVRGKLVEQDANDESGPRLIRRIRLKKAEIIEQGNERKEKLLPPLPANDLPFSLPSGWCWSQLAEIGFINPRNSAEECVKASFVPMTLISADYGVANTHEVRQWGEIKSGFTHFADGDVALAKITPCFENGKSTVFRGLTGGIGAGTTELHVARPVLVSSEYVLIFLKCPHFIDSGVPKMTGTAGQKRVPTSYFANSPFPLPPLAEQDRIVAKVDELMGLCDRMEASQREREGRRDRLTAAAFHHLNNGANAEAFRSYARFFIGHLASLTTRPNQIKQLRQAILNLAVRGRLIPQDCTDDPASNLLETIRKNRLDCKSKEWRQKPLKLPEINLGEAPFELPAGWMWARFPELGFFGRGKSKHRPRNDASLFREGTHLLIQTGDVARSNGLITTHTSKYNELGLAQSMKWPMGTLCITIAANIADSGILSFDACFPDSVVGFIPESNFPNARYFEYFIRTAKANLLEFAPATAQKNINLEILNAVLIPLPPLAEQNRIVAKVDELMALCEQLELSLAKTHTEVNRLLESVLHHALNLATPSSAIVGMEQRLA